MQQKTDPEEKILNCFLQTMDKQPFFKIKVKDLCERAGVSRNCFYAHFDSTYSVIQKIEDDFFDGLTKESESAYFDNSSRTTLEKPLMGPFIIARYLETNKKTFRILCGPNGDMAFQARLLNYARASIVRTIMASQSSVSDVEIEAHSEFIANGMIGLIKHWVLQGGDVATEEWATTTVEILRKMLSFEKKR